MKNILVINSGSSSLKFQLLRMPEEKVLASGQVERIGEEKGKLTYTSEGKSHKEEKEFPDHSRALRAIADTLLDKEKGILEDTSEIHATGHRVVHGGDEFSGIVRIDENVKTAVKELSSLAPLHNPPNLKGIRIAESVFPEAEQFAVFDTTFHHSIPEKARRYAIPKEFYEENRIQAYGFHGISHNYVSNKAIAHTGKEKAKIISLHLGNGCSITATEAGKSMDHSMGFGPATGLIMGTRSGDIDQSVIFYMMNQLGYSAKEVSDILQKKSGMLGLTGHQDLRDIQKKAKGGNKDCQLALEINAYRIKKYIGAYAAALNGLDILIFTAGIGENSDVMRELICQDLEFLGIQLDKEKNQNTANGTLDLTGTGSRVTILVIPTNEELEIARQVYEEVS